MPAQPLAEKIRLMTPGFAQPYQKTGTEMLSTKCLWCTSSSNFMDLCYIYERTKRCLRILHQQRHQNLGLNWTDTG